MSQDPPELDDRSGVRRHPRALGVTLHLPAASRRGFERPSSEWLAAQCRTLAAGLGFAAVGFSTAQRLEQAGTRLLAWLHQGYQGTMGYLEGPVDRADPRSLLPEALSVVSVALPHGPIARPPRARADRSAAPFARYSEGADYHAVIRTRLLILADAIATWIGRPVLARASADSAPVLERELAVRAGLGFIGKSSMLIVPGIGSTVLLGQLLVDVTLAPDAPRTPRCGSCRLCLDACPTGAFVGPYLLDARRCIAYLTIEHRGWIPRDLRPLIGTRVFGCDECQRSCPHNWGRGAQSQPSGLGPVRPRPSLVELLHLGSSAYRRLVKGTVLGRASRQQLARNAAVALGNSGSHHALEPLERALRTHSSALVRGHAAWAIGHLGEQAGVRDLEETSARDPDPNVREEAALARAELGRHFSSVSAPRFK